MSAHALLAKYAAPVPRYTSYPTAPHFHSGVNCGKYAQWLCELKVGSKISLYLHIPYCDRLCWFCACHTKHTLRYEPIATYLQALYLEIDRVGSLVGARASVSAVHFGGGSPTMLTPEDMQAVMQRLRRAFHFAGNVEISVEMDPNDLDDQRYDGLASMGLTRASLGIQDFEPKVQASINRIQTFEQTRAAIEAVRARGVQSVNCDLLYGLPYQTLDTLEKTVNQVLSLNPDRLALFGYAHVPWMKKHQTMIPESALPDAVQRFEQMRLAGDMLMAAGYRPIGIDHFAKPEDSMAKADAEGRLKRNFQGYTVDTADALIGLGASSISQLPQGYVQNIAATGEYQRSVEESGLAAQRGIELSAEDRVRARAIESIMCDFRLSFADLRRLHPGKAEAVIEEAIDFASTNEDNLCRIEEDCLVVTEQGRPLARVIAAVFDTYLANGKARHSIAV
ncbi:oxygen-independent coproporphyrinogen III oxidase [Rhizobium paknamense]|uniref:Coproporphyrinogen-III oxidase n=1 Tax=Rhizobium paknamense TaxID=1206817 RepID=A0ABU0IFS6_9HYPH|nr:oxygen-independent coproporphyrinogen III oxidase [Rhizobium paknamense]MDQ0456069.1 oxygen-independent coproporphyrinogen-3 oxidase [Rhizobium paknamense]